VASNQCRVVRRDTGDKFDLSKEGIGARISSLLVDIQSDMFRRAKADRDEKIVTVTQWDDFVPALNRHCMVLTPFCDQAEWEDKVKVSTFYPSCQRSLCLF
jgi:prolyl-tRNA synthetase